MLENTIEKEFFKKIRIELDEVMNKYLKKHEIMILHYHVGWNDIIFNDVEISRILCITPSRIRQIRTNALMRLRRTKWAFRNRKTFEGLGYISKDYRRMIYYG